MRATPTPITPITPAWDLPHPHLRPITPDPVTSTLPFVRASLSKTTLETSPEKILAAVARLYEQSLCCVGALSRIQGLV